MRELLTVIAAGFVGFLTLLASIAMRLVLFALGLVSVVMLVCAVFCGVGFLVTHRAHDAVNALGFLFYSAVPFVALVVLRVYVGKWKVGREHRQRAANIARLARDVGFAD